MSRDLTGLVNAHSISQRDIDGWRDEVDEFLSMMQDWSTMDPDTVMAQVSSIGARLIEMRCQIVRSELRNVQAFRTKELDPLLTHIKLQFEIHSRRLTSMTLDWNISKGQAT